MSGTVQAVDANAGTFTLAGTTYEIHGASTDGNDLFFRPIGGGGRLYLIANTGTQPTGNVTFSTSFNYNTPTATCFAEGTCLRTTDGERPIETLSVGDLLVGEDGGLHPVRWIGGGACSWPATPSRAILLPSFSNSRR